VIGLVLAAGSGTRLLPHTEHIPKTLLPVAGDRTILDVILGNLAAAGITDVAIVVGHVASAVTCRVPEMQRSHGVRISLIHNDRIDRNNAYSLWLAREFLTEGVFLVNGDTVHPVEVEHALLAKRAPGLCLAVDSFKTLTPEAMKVQLDGSDRVLRITKEMSGEQADGEYLGAAIIEPAVAGEVTECLAQAWRQDPNSFYEAGFQTFADRTGEVHARRIEPVDWVEVDDLADLCRAREIACRY
jgi:choline kinase